MEWYIITDGYDTADGYGLRNGVLVSERKSENLETLGKPVTENNTTLSDVALAKAYEPWPEDDSVCYYLGMVGFDAKDGEEIGLIPFYAYLLPPDGTITFSSDGNEHFEENPYFQIDGFSLEEDVEESTSRTKSWDAVLTGRYVSDNLSAGDHTITLDEIRDVIPEFDVLACWWGDTYILVVCVN